MPTPKCHHCTNCTSSHPTLWWPSPASGISCRSQRGRSVRGYCGQVFEKSPLHMKNFSVWLHCDSLSGTHNMYSQYHHLTPTGAVIRCYTDMGAQHHACAHSIQIMKVEETAACRPASITPCSSSHCHTAVPAQASLHHQKI